MMVNVDEVIKFHGITPKTFGYEKDDNESLENLIIGWIKQAESLIKTYTNNDFKKDMPRAVENICLRLVSNMVRLAIQNRDSPVIKVNDWTTSTVSSEIFTQDLKDDLKPFIKEHSTVSDTVTFYAITGD